MKNETQERLLNRKEVALKFGRSRRWVYDLEHSGCPFKGGYTTESAVWAFLEKKPYPSRIRCRRSEKVRNSPK